MSITARILTAGVTIIIVGVTASTAGADAGADDRAGDDFWAFQRPRPHDLSAVGDPGWARERIDPFVLARIERAGLAPASEADRRTLVRRVTLDLTGLPPEPEDVEAFLGEASPAAYERLVDRLLASPRHGEHRARLWLDLARYAEDQAHIVGDDRRLFYPNAYLYRDWVIDALNADVPYDRFVRLQLAADLLEPAAVEELPALGFIGLGPKYYGRGSLAVKADEWEDRVDVVTRGLLGLTVACARCHDHKYDPISTEDYHALAGVFASTEMFNRPLEGKEAATEEKEEKGKDGDTKKKDGGTKPEDALHIVREGTAEDLHVFVRGDVEQKGPLVRRRFIRVLCGGEPQPFEKGSGRLELADAIADEGNPLTARVLVNRAWGRLFGRSLVGTPSNFGNFGERPTHPELLDDLAVRFASGGWSLKRLERELVLSATYRQASAAAETALRADPENRLFARMARKRLDVEAWRDSLLAASGRLELSLGGPSFEVRDPEARRRTLYGHVSRLQLDSTLALFDFPDPNVHAARRVPTTTPLQKLFVLNSPFMALQARALAERLAAWRPAAGEDPVAARVRRAYEIVYGRPPSERELRLAREYLRASGEPPWERYAQVLLASSEMMFVD